VREYAALPPGAGSPIASTGACRIILGLGPFYQFVLKHRLPFDLPFTYAKERTSVISNNLALAALYGVLCLVAQACARCCSCRIPLVLIAGAAGVWLFYVQHQFEDAYWDRTGAWTASRRRGSAARTTHLPRVLHGSAGTSASTTSITWRPGAELRLEECFRSDPRLRETRWITLRSSLKSASLRLWDEDARRMVSFPDSQIR
jgi:omega-6 fatty acid desaturase (delta-12 desaturase)